MSEDHRQHRKTLYWLVSSLCVIAVAITFAKVKYLDFSLSDKASFYYQADASISFDTEKDQNAHITLSLPERSPLYYFGSDPSGSKLFKVFRTDDGLARAEAEIKPEKNRQTVSYRFKIIPRAYEEVLNLPAPSENEHSAPLSDEAKALVASILEKADPESKLSPQELVSAVLIEVGGLSPADKKVLSQKSGSDAAIDAAITVLGDRGISARVVRGIYLNDKSRNQQAIQFLDAYCNGSWKMFKPSTGAIDTPKDFLVLQRTGKSLFEISGASNSSIRFSVTKVPAGAASLNRIRADVIGEQTLSEFSVFSLPASEQNMLKRLALLPLAILFIVITRNIVGIQTMGTFMPVLIAMAFLEMSLVPGLICFSIILAAGLSIRAWLSKLNLLMVPRISAVVVVVILLMQLISILGNIFDLPDFMSVTFFPLIIIAWTIERASTTWEEDGARNTINQLAASLATAVVSYLVLSNSYLQYFLYTFSELNLAILGVILLLGTYTGYRLTELFRFKSLADK